MCRSFDGNEGGACERNIAWPKLGPGTTTTVIHSEDGRPKHCTWPRKQVFIFGFRNLHFLHHTLKGGRTKMFGASSECFTSRHGQKYGVRRAFVYHCWMSAWMLLKMDVSTTGLYRKFWTLNVKSRRQWSKSLHAKFLPIVLWSLNVGMERWMSTFFLRKYSFCS